MDYKNVVALAEFRKSHPKELSVPKGLEENDFLHAVDSGDEGSIRKAVAGLNEARKKNGLPALTVAFAFSSTFPLVSGGGFDDKVKGAWRVFVHESASPGNGGINKFSSIILPWTRKREITSKLSLRSMISLIACPPSSPCYFWDFAVDTDKPERDRAHSSENHYEVTSYTPSNHC